MRYFLLLTLTLIPLTTHAAPPRIDPEHWAMLKEEPSAASGGASNLGEPMFSYIERCVRTEDCGVPNEGIWAAHGDELVRVISNRGGCWEGDAVTLEVIDHFGVRKGDALRVRYDGNLQRAWKWLLARRDEGFVPVDELTYHIGSGPIGIRYHSPIASLRGPLALHLIDFQLQEDSIAVMLRSMKQRVTWQIGDVALAACTRGRCEERRQWATIQQAFIVDRSLVVRFRLGDGGHCTGSDERVQAFPLPQ